jgi:SAM-dependent methyltransferase
MTMSEETWERIKREELPQAKRLADWIATKHPKTSVVDIGCGPGLYVEEMRVRGVMAYGIDNDPRMIENDVLSRVDIVSDNWLDQATDIALSLEVGEHIPEHGADAYVGFISGTNAHTLYFSAASLGQGGDGHINCQPKSYWIKKLHRVGFWYDFDATEEWLGFMRLGPHMGWLTQNGMVLKRG